MAGMASASYSPEDIILQCKICQEEYSDPRQLECLHSFCLKCIENLRITSLSNQSVACPVCKHDSHVPSGGISDIPASTFIANLQNAINYRSKKVDMCDVCSQSDIIAEFRCLNCSKSMCGTCCNAHNQLEYFSKEHWVRPIGDFREVDLGDVCRGQIEICHIHHGVKLSFFCSDCSVPICLTCHVTSHQEHNCKPLEDVGSIAREDLNTLSGQLHLYKQEHKNKMNTLSDWRKDLLTSRKSIMEKIDVQKKRLLNRLTTYCEDLKTNVNELTDANIKTLDDQIEHLETEMNNITSMADLSKAMVKYGRDAETEHTKNKFHSLVQKQQCLIKEQYKQIELKLTLGHMTTFQPEVVVGKCCEVDVTQGSADQPPRSLSATQSTAGITRSPPTHNITAASVEASKSDGLVSKKVKCKTSLIANFRVPFQPNGIAELSEGIVIVTGYMSEIRHGTSYVKKASGRIEIYTSDGTRKGSNSPKWHQSYWAPWGVAVAPNKYILVSDHIGNTIDVFSPNLSSRQTFLKVERPTGLAIFNDGTGRIALLFKDGDSSCLAVFSADGKQRLSSTAGQQGYNYYLGLIAYCVAIIPITNDLVVTHAEGVSSFTSKCIYRWHYPCIKHNEQILIAPRGVSTTEDKIFVADHEGHQVVILNTSGEFLRSILTRPVGFPNPKDLMVTGRGHLLVAYTSDNKIRIYKYEEQVEKKKVPTEEY